MLRGRKVADSLIADAEIIVSELLTNAVNARCTEAQLVLSTQENCVRIEVGDNASGVPTQQSPSLEDEHGRGLLIVAALASQWGVIKFDGGKRVWAELAFG